MGKCLRNRSSYPLIRFIIFQEANARVLCSDSTSAMWEPADWLMERFSSSQKRFGWTSRRVRTQDDVGGERISERDFRLLQTDATNGLTTSNSSAEHSPEGRPHPYSEMQCHTKRPGRMLRSDGCPTQSDWMNRSRKTRSGVIADRLNSAATAAGSSAHTSPFSVQSQGCRCSSTSRTTFAFLLR